MIFPDAKSIICGYLISLLSSSPYKYKILKLSFKNDSDKERIQWNFMYSPQNCLYSSLQISPYLVSKHSFLGKQINNLGQIDLPPQKNASKIMFSFVYLAPDQQLQTVGQFGGSRIYMFGLKILKMYWNICFMSCPFVLQTRLKR